MIKGKCNHCGECCLDLIGKMKGLQCANFFPKDCYDPIKKRCKIYEHRPDICKNFPQSKKALTYKNCGYQEEK